MRLLNELVKVEVTDDHPSFPPSWTGVDERGVVAPEIVPGVPIVGVLGTVPETDRVGRKALGGATFTVSDVRRIIEGGTRGLLYPVSDSDMLGLRAFIVSTGS